ncbi:hypothetical protein ACFQ0R_06900 [Psychroflexus salinarum]|uniref:Uncharacterized protein n=1 Tax=Psychroflexus salinarum TaxID=546024 RepID=A0ABW3GNZ2_9FLAO
MSILPFSFLFIQTNDSFRIESGYVTLIGGIQNQFLDDLYSDSLVASGFIDRLLFTTLITRNTKISDQKMSQDVIDNYCEAITGRSHWFESSMTHRKKGSIACFLML